MMWTLVLIAVFQDEIQVEKLATLDDMYECFEEYDKYYYSMSPEKRRGIRFTCVEGIVDDES